MDNKVCQTHTQEFIDQTQGQFIIAGVTLLKVVSGESLPLCRDFYQVVQRLLNVIHFCYFFLFVCASAHITCAISTSRTLLPRIFTLVNLTAALRTGVATMSSLAQLQVQDSEEQKQCRRNDARLTESANSL